MIFVLHLLFLFLPLHQQTTKDMNYADKCLISIKAAKIAKAKDLNILCQYGKLNGKNTASLTVDGVESLFTKYESASKFLESL